MGAGKILTRIMIVFLLFFSILSNSGLAKYSGGIGDPNDPYQIATAADLLTLAADANDYNKCFIMTADIDLDPCLPGGQVFTTAVIARDTCNTNEGIFDGVVFTGVFDSAGHKISNLTIDTNNNSNDYLGLFGVVYQPGLIKNLGVTNAMIRCGDNSYYVGTLVGYNDSVTIINSYCSGGITTGTSCHSIGGLVGENVDSAWIAVEINNCFSASTVTCGDGTEKVGGFVGWNLYPNITDCFTTGAVSVGDSASYVGGFVGWSRGGILISRSFSTGDVTVGSHSEYIGGFVGDVMNGEIRDCYSQGAVIAGNGSRDVGGLGGTTEGVPVKVCNCYSTGAVTAGVGSSYVGGLMGSSIASKIHNSFWDVNTSGQSTSAGGTGKTTAEMQTQSTFIDAGWDFVWETVNGPNDIWAICEGVDYPKLAWQFVVGDSDNDKDVDFVDFAALGLKWMQADSNLYCGGMDLTGDGFVDLNDLAIMCDYWLEGL